MWHPWQLLSTLRRPARVLDKVTTTHHRVLDHVTAKLTHHPLLFPQGFFSDGWGDLHVPSLLSQRLATDEKFAVAPIVDLQLTPLRRLRRQAPLIVQGSFRTTLRDHAVLLPPVCHTAYFELILPPEMAATASTSPLHIDGSKRPLVVLLPGTGEHGCTHRRLSVAEPLARAGVATLVLEGAFYGRRRPPNQKGSKLRHVSDLPILGLTTIEEAKSLLHHFQSHFQFEQLVVAGGSMGGLHAAMTAALYPGDVGAASWVAPPSAIPAFTRGLLALSCNWQSLSQQKELAMIDHLLSGHVSDYATAYSDEVAHVKQRLSAFLALTNIENFPAPRREDAVVFSQATEDQYIGRNDDQWQLLMQRWPRATFRHVTAGHVSGLLFNSDAFVATILDVITTLQKPRSR
ncbi:hypothetical protein, variant [Saprolegnia diclina VS20]|uniref:Uncharacterized protein n=1 Tax=Saprolegnia diclina (strain VS20) TaxID=1156394 RepID=T0QZU6_SAPDV|nr:hypothetical protein, variant [Saprolegnia diclina VS20]EQC39565.1 hypothetical protein, variant [Saprolegnia diclina VS20]|eukprot:XP_008606837.1 hypothetical protein, variant [Saprolegnia diclina VS20]